MGSYISKSTVSNTGINDIKAARENDPDNLDNSEIKRDDNSEIESDDNSEIERDIIDWGERNTSEFTINTTWKNRPYDLSNTYIWVFSSRNNDSWWFMPQSTSDQVEELYQLYLGEGIDNEQLSYNRYNFKIMKQINTVSRTLRNIERIDTNDYLNLAIKYKNNLDSRDTYYVCEMDRDYIVYPPSVQDMINSSSDPEIHFDDYLIDLVNMQQITSKNRNIYKVETSKTGNRHIHGAYGYNSLF